MGTPSLRRKFLCKVILPAGSSLRKTNSQRETSNLSGHGDPDCRMHASQLGTQESIKRKYRIRVSMYIRCW